VNAHRVPATFHAVYADNGDPLLLYGVDEADGMFLWPTPHIAKHPIAFGRYCRQHVGELRGRRLTFNHPLTWKTQRWADWLGVNFEAGVV